MRSYLFILMLGFSALFSACKKDDDKLSQTCEDFPQSQAILGYRKITKPNAAYTPAFNPNNAQELCFGRNITTPDGDYKIELWKVNLATGQQQKLSDEFWGQPDWGKNGWILFEKPGNQIYKIKSNGDSLTQLHFPNVCFNPRWNLATGGFLNNISNYNGSTAVERSIDGQLIQYVQSRMLHYFVISPGGKKMAVSYDEGANNKFSLFDYPSLKETVLREMDSSKGESVGFKVWHPDNLHVFWTSRKGVFKTNVATKQTLQLKTGCDSRYYNALSVSPDGQSLAITRYDYKLVDVNTLEAEISIYLMDANGNNERKLEL